MKEIKTILSACDSRSAHPQGAALATVAGVQGSAYRRTGARMLVLEDGTYLGGISGGCLEGDALRRAQKAIASNKAAVITYDTTRDDHHQIGIGLGCKGVVDVLFTPLNPDDPHNPVHVLRPLTTTRTLRGVVSITGAISHPEWLGFMLPFENEAQFAAQFPISELTPAVLSDLRLSLVQARSQTVNYSTDAGQSFRLFLEILVPDIHLVIFGSNNDVIPTTRMAKELGWKVSLVTNLHKAGKDLFTLADQVFHNKEAARPVIDAYTALLLMTHDYKSDFQYLQELLPSTAPYLGILGPRTRALQMFDALAEKNRPLSDAEEARIFAPAGLDIGALTPEEIALSIVAEIRSCFARRPGTPLRLREGPIH